MSMLRPIWLYLTIHNLIQTEIMLDEARKSILESDFENFKKRGPKGELLIFDPQG